MAKENIFPLFTHIYNPSFTLAIAEKKYNRKDILLYYENSENRFVFSCSKSVSYYGIKPGLSVDFAKKLTDNFFLLPCYEFTKQSQILKESLLNELKKYAFAVYELPSSAVNFDLFDSISLIADFSGCQLIYKPIFFSLDSIFKNCLKIAKNIPFSFLTSNSFTFSLFCVNNFNFNFEKSFFFNFINSKQFLNFIKLKQILSPLSFFEEIGIFFFTDFAVLPFKFQEKLLDLAIISSPLSKRIKLSSKLKALIQPLCSTKKFEPLDLFLFKVIQRLFTFAEKNRFEIPINFSPPTNDKSNIGSHIRKQLYQESYFLKNYWLHSDSEQIFATIEYTNSSIDRFGLFFPRKDVLSFFKSISEEIILRLKGKSSVSRIILEFDQKKCEDLFNFDNNAEDNKLLSLFDLLIQKFGSKKIHLAG